MPEPRSEVLQGTLDMLVLKMLSVEPMHGWGLSPACYADGVSRLTAAGVRVLAPCLPGFGGRRS